MTISLDQNKSTYHQPQPEILLSKENEIPVTSGLRPLRYYDGKLLWRTSNMKLNLFDVVGKSVAEITLESSKLNGKTSIFSKELEKLASFDVLIENAARTKYPTIVDRNDIKVIPSAVSKTSIQFDKQVIIEL